MKRVVLIVEDNASNIKLFRELLGIAGYETMEASDGKQGIEMAKAHKPDLILMDISMPVMDGLEATRILKSDPQTKNIPIIALTSHAMKGDEEKALKAGCIGYLPKPINTRTFPETIKSYLRKKT